MKSSRSASTSLIVSDKHLLDPPNAKESGSKQKMHPCLRTSFGTTLVELNTEYQEFEKLFICWTLKLHPDF